MTMVILKCISDSAAEELKKLLLLILGCAVQCSKKEEIIESIKKFDLDIQHSIVECIQQVVIYDIVRGKNPPDS